jgi:hypothetical protein
MKLLRAIILVVFTILFGFALLIACLAGIYVAALSPFLFLAFLVKLGEGGSGYKAIAIWIFTIVATPCVVILLTRKLWRRINYYYFVPIVSADFGGPVRYGTLSYGVLTGREKLLSVVTGTALAIPLVYWIVKYYPS